MDMVDSPVGPLGQVLSDVMASQASMEGVFSSAGWEAHDPERMSRKRLEWEVYIRVNSFTDQACTFRLSLGMPARHSQHHSGHMGPSCPVFRC